MTVVCSNNDKKTVPSHMEQLNRATVRAGEDFNILSTGTQYSRAKRMIVEAPAIGLNYINRYSLDGSFGKTICIGNKLENIEKIQNIDRWDRICSFRSLRLFPEFWGVLYLNESEKISQTGRKTLPFIFLFDWNGNPVAKLKLNSFITSFNIDLLNGYLYTMDNQTEKFCKYDIRDILKKLKK
jgi:hypothetical protein